MGGKMFCINCGNTLSQGAMFCNNCGQKTAAGQGAVATAQRVDTGQAAHRPAPGASGAGAAVPGRGFLKVTGILYIVFGGIGLASGAFALAALDAATGAAAGVFGDVLTQATAGLRAAAILSLIWAGYQLFLGIMGVRFCAELDKASMLIVLGGLDVVLIFIAIVQLGFSFLTLLSFPLPILFIYGAYKNKAVVGF